MSLDLESVLGFVPLGEALRATTSGIPDPFPAELAAVKPANKVLGDQAQYIRITGNRRTAPLTVYGAPAKRVPLMDVSGQRVRCLHTFLEIQIDLITLQKLQAFEQFVQDEGMDWLRYQIEEKAKQIANTRIVAKASMLQYGAIYWDGQGNVLPTSSGAAETVGSQLGGTHQNQLNGIIANSWALGNTDIPGQIRTLHQTSAQATGLPPETALYGINIPKYFAQNVFMNPFLSRDGRFRDYYNETGEIPDGLAGIKKWVPVYHAFYEDQTGTNQTLWGADAVVFMPKLQQPDKMDWWAMFEGSYPVPKSLEIAADPMGALSNYKFEYGQFGYAIPNITQSPPGITAYFGDVHLPLIRNELALWSATVAF